MHNSLFRYSLWTVLTFVLLCCFAGNLAFAADQAAPGTKQPAADIKSSDTKDKKEIIWHTYKDGLALGNAESKKIFLHLYTNKCHYCRVMQEKTFVDNGVINLLNDKFISIKINLTEDPSLRSQFPAPGVPMSWFMENNGDKIGARPGYLPPEQFVALLQHIIDEKYKNQ